MKTILDKCHIKLWQIMICFIIILFPSTTVYALSAAEEYEIKAAFLYNLGSFLYFPSTTLSTRDINQPFYICILGTDPFKENIDVIAQDQTVNNHPVQIERLQKAQQATHCHVLFISTSEEYQIKSILQTLDKHPILTVSDMRNFLEQGGMLKFYNEDDTVRLALDSERIAAVSLKPSAHLLRVAKDTKF